MSWTRLSFIYLIGYLTFGGLGLLFSPKLALGLFGATGNYRPELARLSGALLLGLGILVIQDSIPKLAPSRRFRRPWPEPSGSETRWDPT